MVWAAIAILFSSTSLAATPQLCSQVGRDSSLGIVESILEADRPLFRKFLNSGSSKEIIETFRTKCPGPCAGLAPWPLSFSDRPEVRYASLRLQFERIAFRLWEAEMAQPWTPSADATESTVSNDLRSLAKWIEAQPAPGAEARAQFLQFMKLWKDKGANMWLSTKLAPFLCSIRGGIYCASAMRSMLSLSGTKQLDSEDLEKIVGTNFSPVVYYSFPDFYRTALTDPAFKTFLLAALVEVTKELDLHTHRDLPKLLADAAVEAKTPASKQNDFVWIILGFFGSRGTSWDGLFPFFHADHLPVLAGLAAFSSAANWLDSKRFETDGTAFSLPAEIRLSGCRTAKTYHFWMAATLSHLYLNQTHAPKADKYPAAVSAVHNLGLGYEFSSSTNLRQNKIIATKNSLSTHNTSIRINQSLKDMGAIWSFDHRIQNLSDAVSMMESASSQSRKNVSKTASWNIFAFLTWSDQLGINAYLDQINRSLGVTP